MQTLSETLYCIYTSTLLTQLRLVMGGLQPCPTRRGTVTRGYVPTAQWRLQQCENIRGWQVCCGGFCSSHLEIPEDKSCRCKFQIWWCSRCAAPTVLLFAVWLPAPSVPLSQCRHFALSNSCSFTSPPQFIFSLFRCLLQFTPSAGFTIRTIILLSLTMCTFILLPTYFTWVDAWAWKHLWYSRLARVCIWWNGSWLFSSFLHFTVDTHFVALLLFF